MISQIKRYVTDKASSAIADYVLGAKNSRKEAVGYSNMAKLIKLNRQTKGRYSTGLDSSDPEFRMEVKARNAKTDYQSKDKAKLARQFYQTLY